MMKPDIESDAARSGEDADKNRKKLIEDAEATLKSSRSHGELSEGFRGGHKSG
jgi:hypothetical protein